MNLPADMTVAVLLDLNARPSLQATGDNICKEILTVWRNNFDFKIIELCRGRFIWIQHFVFPFVYLTYRTERL